jgi:hypothetical protein
MSGMNIFLPNSKVKPIRLYARLINLTIKIEPINYGNVTV